MVAIASPRTFGDRRRRRRARSAFACPLGTCAATPRVIGGTSIGPQDAPWSAYIRMANAESSVCTGSVIDASHVLSAAHCLVRPGTTTALAPADVSVLVGAADAGTWQPGQASPPGAQARGAAAVSVHPFYNRTSFVDDVGIITLAQPLDLTTATVRPITRAARGGGLRAAQHRE